MIKEYFLNINEISDSDISFIKTNYKERYNEALRFKFKEDFMRSIASYVLLVKAIGDFSEDDIEYVNYKPTIKGKPCFSFSHSNELIYLVVCDKLVGADVEFIKENNERVANAIVAESEKDFLEKDRITNTHILWTRKEALLKMLALGMQKDEIKKMDSNDTSITYKDITYKCVSYVKDGYAFSYVIDK